MAAYFVHWTLHQVDRHGAHFDLIVGDWGEGTSSSDRSAVSLEFRRTQSGPAFRLIDAADRPTGSTALAANVLSRESVIGTSLATFAFEIVDQIWLRDERIAEIVGAAG